MTSTTFIGQNDCVGSITVVRESKKKKQFKMELFRFTFFANFFWHREMNRKMFGKITYRTQCTTNELSKCKNP